MAKKEADKKLLNMFVNSLADSDDITKNEFNKEIVECFLMGEDNI